MLDYFTVFAGLLLVRKIRTTPDRRRETGGRGTGCIGARKRAAATTIIAYPCAWLILSNLMWSMYSVAMMLSCSLNDFGCFHIGDVFIPRIIVLPRPKKPPDKCRRPLSYIEKRFHMEKLLQRHRNSIKLHIQHTNVNGAKAPPPLHGGASAPLRNKVSVKTPPPLHGGDSAPLSTNPKQQSDEREIPIIKRKEQARIIENNIRLFFETSIRLHSTSPKYTPQSLLAATKRHMAGDSEGLTSTTASTLRQLLQTAPASLLSEIEEMVIFDTGATRAVSYDENDFVGPLRPITKRLAGIGAGLDVAGIGTIR
mgnify:FL=1